MPLEMIEGNKSALGVVKRDTLRETVWQKMSTCIKKRKQKKMLI